MLIQKLLKNLTKQNLAIHTKATGQNLAFNTKATGEKLPVDTKATEKVDLDRT
jgi:hypothetical protein